MLFRGDFRVKLPFASITGVSARDGVLTLKSTEGVLTLAIGAKAEKWAAAITSPKSRIDKIGVKSGQRVSVMGVRDRAFVDELKAAGADVSERLRKGSDAIFVAVESGADLRRIASLAKSLAPSRRAVGDPPQGRRRRV